MTIHLAWRHFERGRNYEIQSRLNEAIDAYRKAIDLKPDFPDAFFALGRIEANRGRNAEAVALFDQAVAIKTTPEMLEWRAFVNGRLKRYEAALADYRVVVAGGEAHARINLGRILLALGRYDEAEEALRSASDDAAAVLLDALPRYREYASADATEDARAVRYLFARTVLLGTLADGGMRPRSAGGWCFTGGHFNITWRRFLAMARGERWHFDGVAGDGALHGPVADWAAQDAGWSRLSTPAAAVAAGVGQVLLVSAVVEGVAQARQLVQPWRAAGLKVLHLVFAFMPTGQPAMDEPELVGFVGRCFVSWYRVNELSRLEFDPESTDPRWPGWRLQIPFVDPNRARVVAGLVAEAATAPPDRQRRRVVDYYRVSHRQVRAFEWDQKQPGGEKS